MGWGSYMLLYYLNTFEYKEAYENQPKLSVPWVTYYISW